MVLSGLEYMHKTGIAHRDLKIENMVLDRKYIPKIIDFGLATYLKRGVLKSKVGTVSYYPPEVHIGKYLGNEVDIFCLAVVLFIIALGTAPFQESTTKCIFYYKFIENNKEYWKDFKGFLKESADSVLTDEFIDLMNKMLHYNRKNRLTI